jgi:hypothetical protein
LTREAREATPTHDLAAELEDVLAHEVAAAEAANTTAPCVDADT